jgi:hypothetical protein
VKLCPGASTTSAPPFAARARSINSPNRSSAIEVTVTGSVRAALVLMTVNVSVTAVPSTAAMFTLRIRLLSESAMSRFPAASTATPWG